jgi:hypothetical protein
VTVHDRSADAGLPVLNIRGNTRLITQFVLHDRVDVNHVRWLRERFASPPGYTEVVTSLHLRRTALLHCSAGGGRTTGICALADVGGVLDRPVEVVEVDHGTDLRLRAVEPGALLLVDLRTAPERDLRRAEEWFADGVAEVLERGARLVVLLSGRESRAFLAAHGELCVDVGTPGPEHVLMAHLSADGLTGHLPRVLGSPAVRAALHGAAPRDVARFARTVLRVGVDRSGPADPDDQLDHVLSTHRRWSDLLVREFDGCSTDDHRRALLLSLALFDGGRSYAVHRAEELLLAITGSVDPSPNPLLGRAFADRVAEIDGVAVDGERARFARRDYAASVLHHVWSRFPQLRDPLVEWIATVALDERAALDRAEQAGLAVRFLDLCAAGGSARPVLDVAARWVRTDPSLAAGLLDAAAVDDRIGGDVRRGLLAWARQPDLDGRLADAVARVCGGDLGRVHPELALVRLGHLSEHDDPRVTRHVVTAAGEIARDPAALPLVLSKAVGWLRDGSERQWLVGAHVLSALTGAGGPAEHLPGRLRLVVISGWNALLSGPDRLLVTAAVRERLVQAIDLVARARVLEALVSAALGDVDLLDLLGMTADRWRGDPAVVRDLLARLDRVHPASFRVGEGALVLR